MPREQLLEAKVVVLGSQGVGKTSLVVRFVQQKFNATPHPTLGATFLTKKLNVDGTEVKFQIWDTAGQERFRSMAPMYYRGAHAAIIVYGITSEHSFLDVSSWIEELKSNMGDHLPIIHIVGTKLDLADTQRKVHPGLAAEYARTCIPSPISSPCTFSMPGSPKTITRPDRRARPTNISTSPYLPETVMRRRASVQADVGPPSAPCYSFSQPPHLAVAIAGARPRSISISHSGSKSTSLSASPSFRQLLKSSHCHRRTTSMSTAQTSPLSAEPPSTSPLSLTSISSAAQPRHPWITLPLQFQFPPPKKLPSADRGSPSTSSTPPAPPIVTWSEVSAKEDEGVQALFVNLARRLVQQKESIEKSRERTNIVRLDAVKESSPSAERQRNATSCCGV